LQLSGVELRELPYDYEAALDQAPPDHRGILMTPSALLCTAVVGVGVLSNLWSFLFKEPSSVLKGGEQG